MEELTSLQKQLFALQDTGYREFHSRLMPNIDREKIIGIRIPVLRKFAKTFMKTEEAGVFIRELPHIYYEENNLHMMMITAIKDYDRCLAQVERFLPYIDNWATCDFPEPKCFARHKPELLTHIREWIASKDTYTVRYGIGMLMRLYLDEDYAPEYPAMVAEVVSEEYYVNMMSAWYFATALAKQWDSVIAYIEKRKLSSVVHRKAIQKAIESYRITPEQKDYLRTLKR